MTIATLDEVLEPALGRGHAIAGLVCLGWEDMRAYAEAAEIEGLAVILQAGPSCRAHTPLPVLGAMMRHLAERATVPVVVHLDHGYSADECREAIESGFSSVMYDGSRKPLDENIAETAAIVELAHGAGVSCEGEIGFVGYAEGKTSSGTDPAEAEAFARDTGIDAMAVSVGNVHLQNVGAGSVDLHALDAIRARTDVPLVIHGGSGIPPEQRRDLARRGLVQKFNIGTELRQAFGDALRDRLARDARSFDRIEILRDVEEAMVERARSVIRNLGPA